MKDDERSSHETKIIENIVAVPGFSLDLDGSAQGPSLPPPHPHPPKGGALRGVRLGAVGAHIPEGRTVRIMICLEQTNLWLYSQ